MIDRKDNLRRARLAKRTLDYFRKIAKMQGEPEQTVLVDLLADLHHLSHEAVGLDYMQAGLNAAAHFYEETH